LILTNPPGDWGVVGPTFGDGVDMIEHRKSGLEKALGPAVVKWNRSLGELYVANGAVVYVDGADDGALRIQGEGLRGAWADEIGLWKVTKTRKGEEKGGLRAWKESLVFAVRESPALIVATGTPKGNVGVVKYLRSLPEGRVVETHPSLDDNRVNLEPEIVAEWEELYAGTRLERQELRGEVLEDVEGALWHLELIEADRMDRALLPEVLRASGSRTVVGVDPAGTQAGDETGIVAAARVPGKADLFREFGEDERRVDHGFVLADRSGHYTPNGWAQAAIDLYRELRADRIVAERNYGGDLVKNTIRMLDPSVPVSTVWAAKGKEARAEPVVGLYEQHRVHHLGGFPELESEQTSWVPGGPSPNRLDAVVWALTDLLVEGSGLRPGAVPEGQRAPEPITAGLLDQQW
jgi:phage terminase large subunit-like protein